MFISRLIEYTPQARAVGSQQRNLNGTTTPFADILVFGEIDQTFGTFINA